MKQKLIEPILEVLFPILCTPDEHEEDEDDFDEQSSNPNHYAAEVLLISTDYLYMC